MLRVGIDLVQVSRIAESIATFGDRFTTRVFTDGERAYAESAPALTAARLAARFAAKEAVKKALRVDGVGWRDIEIVREADGAPAIVLHGTLAERGEVAVSLSHEGDHATAVAIVDGEQE